MDENEALVGELRRYLSSAQNRSPSDESEPVRHLKRELNLAARVGQQILMQLQAAEKAKAVCALEIAKLRAQNAQLQHDNQKLAVDQELLSAAIEQQDAEIAALTAQLGTARKKTAQMARAAASARALEREIEMLAELHASLTQELGASRQQRDAAEKLARGLASNLAQHLSPVYEELRSETESDAPSLAALSAARPVPSSPIVPTKPETPGGTDTDEMLGGETNVGVDDHATLRGSPQSQRTPAALHTSVALSAAPAHPAATPHTSLSTHPLTQKADACTLSFPSEELAPVRQPPSPADINTNVDKAIVDSFTDDGFSLNKGPDHDDAAGGTPPGRTPSRSQSVISSTAESSTILPEVPAPLETETSHPPRSTPKPMRISRSMAAPHGTPLRAPARSPVHGRLTADDSTQSLAEDTLPSLVADTTLADSSENGTALEEGATAGNVTTLDDDFSLEDAGPGETWLTAMDLQPSRPWLPRSRSHESIFSAAADGPFAGHNSALRPLTMETVKTARTVAAVSGEHYGEAIQPVKKSARDKLSAMRAPPDRRRWGFFLH